MDFLPFLFLQCWFCISVAFCDEFDYTKVNFCAKEMACEGVTNTGCGCKFNAGIKEITTDLNEFRQAMVEIHNKLRQRIASGGEKNHSLSEASNMNVLNYDLELEHLAKCWFMGKDGLMGTTYHDKCRKTKTFDLGAGQNLAFRSNERWHTKKEYFHEPVQLWYDEVTQASQSLIDEFALAGMSAGHFTQVVWAKATHLGCARGCKAIPEANKIDVYQCGVVCNYAGKNELMNCLTTAVYKSGKGCSACEDGKKCNSKYTSLCGELEPIPHESLKALSGGSDRSGSTLQIHLISLLIWYLFAYAY